MPHHFSFGFFFHEKILKSSTFEDLCSTLSHPRHLIQSFTKPCGYYFSEIPALTLTSLVPFALPRAHALITDRAPGSSSSSPLDLTSVTLLSNLQIDQLPSFPHTIPPFLMQTPHQLGLSTISSPLDPPQHPQCSCMTSFSMVLLPYPVASLGSFSFNATLFLSVPWVEMPSVFLGPS